MLTLLAFAFFAYYFLAMLLVISSDPILQAHPLPQVRVPSLVAYPISQ
jgi:hypothetical protein